MMTYEESIILAKKLRALSPAILSVELFGSVLTNGHGRDADFLILVNDDLAEHWWEKAGELVRVRWPDSLYEKRWIVKKFTPFMYAATVNKRRQERLEVSASMLGIELMKLADSNGRVPDFEMFLVPEEWRVGKEINMNLMTQMTKLVKNRNTAGFLKRIAKDAIKIA